jgi:formylglycine-generating enzyme required for sulfatase activity
MIAVQKFFHVTILFILISALSHYQTEVHGKDLKSTNRDSAEMKIIPAGEFLMGSKPSEGRADEQPQRKVYLAAYAIDIHEVTNEQYLHFIHSTGRKEPPNPYGDRLLSEETDVASLPVVQVTWHDAVDYCRWAGKRLPTEAEWEKAARGGNGALFPWGSQSPRAKPINFKRNWKGTKTLWSVGSHKETSSPYGIHDMSGNVREWTQDWYAPDYYAYAPNRNPQGPRIGILKVIKGGSWHSFIGDIRPAARGKGGFALKTDGIGFRCARSIKNF